MSSVTLVSNTSSIDILSREESRNFHHHDKRDKHVYGQGKFRHSSYEPAYADGRRFVQNVNEWVQKSACVTKGSVEADLLREAFTDILTEVAKQNHYGQCSLRADWAGLDESNKISRVFKAFAQALDRDAEQRAGQNEWQDYLVNDQFSWGKAGKIWYRAMTKLSANPTVIEFKLLTLEVARKMYPARQREVKSILLQAWNQVETEMKTQLVLDGKNVTEICFKSSGGFTGLTETSTIPVQKLDADALIWLEKYFTNPAVEIVPDQGTTPVTTMTYVFADGSQVTKYYDLQNLPQSLQDAISDPACRKIGAPE